VAGSIPAAYTNSGPEKSGPFLGLRQDNPCRDVRGFKERERDHYITDHELAAIRAGALTGSDGVADRSGEMIVCLINLS
jgi:hypothetical protein